MKRIHSLIVALFLVISVPAALTLPDVAHADVVLREDTASQVVLIGPFVDTAGDVVTGLTIDAADVRLSKNGANIVGKNSGGCTHDELGMYACTFDATDSSDVGRLQVMVDESGALPVYHEFQVAEESVYDACCASGATSINLEQLIRADAAVVNCTVNTANFAGSTTTVACILTDRDDGAITAASGDLEGRELLILSGAQIYEGRFINDTTWDGANSELRLTLSRALPGTLADAVTAIIR